MPPVTQINGNQVINRFATLNTTLWGPIDLITMGDIPDVVSTTQMPTGQVRSTGQVQNADVQCSVMDSDTTAVTAIQKWHEMTKTGKAAGTPGSYVDSACSVQFWNEDQTPGPLVEFEEVFPHTKTFMGTDVSAEGEAKQFQFTLTMRAPTRAAGT